MADGRWPRLRAVLLCERVHTDPDGVVSALRLVDRVAFEGPREPTPVAALAALLVIDGGEGSPGVHRLRMRTRLPSGREVGHHEMQVALPAGPLPEARVILDVRLETGEPGVHRLLFSLDEQEEVVRVPLLVELALEDEHAEPR